jgi:hypothetical protein
MPSSQLPQVVVLSGQPPPPPPEELLVSGPDIQALIPTSGPMGPLSSSTTTVSFGSNIKSFPLDFEKIIVRHFDIEGDSMKKVESVINSTSIVKNRTFSF